MKPVKAVAFLIACLCVVPRPINTAKAADTTLARERNAQTLSGAWNGTFETNAVTLDGMEIRFTGELAANLLAGNAEGFREGAKVGSGKWQLSRITAPAVSPTRPGQQPAAQSIENDTEAIRQVIRQYLDVTDKKDAEAIKKAFHPDTKLLSAGKNGLNQMTLEEWWSRVSRIPGNVERKSQVTVLEVSGLAAVIKIDFGRSKDYVSLLKINGEWKIVSKILSTSLN